MRKYDLTPAENAAYDFVPTMVERADGTFSGSPWWYGWALREAFAAGVEWEQRRAAQGGKEAKGE